MTKVNVTNIFKNKCILKSKCKFKFEIRLTNIFPSTFTAYKEFIPFKYPAPIDEEAAKKKKKGGGKNKQEE